MELSDYVNILRRYWIALGIAVIVGIFLAFIWSSVQPRVYAANASAFVKTVQSDNLTLAMAGDSYAKSRAQSYLDVAESRETAKAVIKDLNLQTTPEALITKVSATVPSDTVVIKITAKGNTPTEARDLADSWIAQLAEQVKNLEDDQAFLEEQNGSAAETNQAAPTFVRIEPVQSASLPTSPVSPNLRLNLALGALIGLCVGVGYALIRNHYDKRIRSGTIVEKKFQLPVIGMLPLNTALDDEHRLAEFIDESSLTRQKSTQKYLNNITMKECLKELRTNLQFIDVDEPPRIIVITSAVSNEGKSTLAANLALTLAESGQKTTIVDTDLRNPTVDRVFGIDSDIGLTDVLADQVLLDYALQPWRNSDLQILTAGHRPPNPSELLGSKAMNQLLHELAKDSIVLLDAPPLLPVTDAAVLSGHADGALLVTSYGSTTEDQLERAVTNIEKVKGRILGVILNRFRQTKTQKRDYYYYGQKTSEASQRPRNPNSPKLEPAMDWTETAAKNRTDSPRRRATTLD